MTLASKALRWMEAALWILGVCLVGAALVATLNRWNYQAREERALFSGGPAISPAPPASVVPADPPAGLPATPNAADSTPTYLAVSRVETKPAPRHLAPTALGRIEIPRLGMRAMVKEGGDEKTLSRAVGLIPGSAKPGQRGNIVLAGHRDTFFRPLQGIRVNDQIRITVPPHTYEYRVEWVSVVSPDDTGLLRSRGKEELTLVTCYPFTWVGPSPERFVVNAVRVN